MNNYTHFNVRDEIAYSFLNCNYLSMLGLKLIHFSKRGTGDRPATNPGLTRNAQLYHRQYHTNFIYNMPYWYYPIGAQAGMIWETYRRTSSISRTKSQSLNVSSLLLQVSLRNLLKSCDSWLQNKRVVRATPTGDAANTSEWSTISLPIKVRVISEVWG